MGTCQTCGRTYPEHLRDQPGHFFTTVPAPEPPSTCIGCGVEIPAEDDACAACVGEDQPDEDDAYITDKPMSGYDVSLGLEFLGNFDDRHEAERALIGRMERDGFWPNVWLIDDHGGRTPIELEVS